MKKYILTILCLLNILFLGKLLADQPLPSEILIEPTTQTTDPAEVAYDYAVTAEKQITDVISQIDSIIYAKEWPLETNPLPDLVKSLTLAQSNLEEAAYLGYEEHDCYHYENGFLSWLFNLIHINKYDCPIFTDDQIAYIEEAYEMAGDAGKILSGNAIINDPLNFPNILVQARVRLLSSLGNINYALIDNYTPEVLKDLGLSDLDMLLATNGFSTEELANIKALYKLAQSQQSATLGEEYSKVAGLLINDASDTMIQWRDELTETGLEVPMANPEEETVPINDSNSIGIENRDALVETLLLAAKILDQSRETSESSQQAFSITQAMLKTLESSNMFTDQAEFMEDEYYFLEALIAAIPKIKEISEDIEDAYGYNLEDLNLEDLS